ncbi:MAG: extracellular solute-binding protein, partial [Eubacteriales bacterium]|nr:extracellular solute-binding protein [Eubacteriales bacterium]
MRKMLAVLLMFSVILGMSTALASEKPYEGTEIRVLLANHMWADALIPHLGEFEENTGIKVNYEQYSEDQLSQKLSIELAAKGEDVDVMMTRPLQEVKQMIENGWLYDVSALIEEPEMDGQDFFSAALNMYGSEGKYFGVPLVTEREILYYRKDLFQEAGVEIPTTLDELWA